MSRRSRLRRNERPRPWSPLQLPGLTGWWRADSGVTIATGVSSWAAINNTSLTFTQAVGANQPARGTRSTFNNQLVLTCDGTDTMDGPVASSLMSTTAGTFIVVGEYSAAAYAHTTVAVYDTLGVTDNSSNFGNPVGDSGKAYVYEWDGAAKSTQIASGLAASTAYAFYWRRNATTISGRVNSGAWASTASGAGDRSQTMFINAIAAGLAPFYLAEIICLNVELPDNEATVIQNYLQARYRL